MPFNNFNTGRRSQINTSGIPLSDSDIVTQNGVTIVSEGSVWVGPSNMGWTDANAGLPLVSGDSLFLPTRHTSDIYVQAVTSGNTVYWAAV